MAIARLPSGSFRARFEAALKRRLCPVLGELPLVEVLEADRDHLEHRLVAAGIDDPLVAATPDGTAGLQRQAPRPLADAQRKLRDLVRRAARLHPQVGPLAQHHAARASQTCRST